MPYLLFNREASFVFSAPFVGPLNLTSSSGAFVGPPGLEPTPPSVGREITGLRMKFRAVKTSDSSANTCKLTIYNLAQQTADAIRSDPSLIGFLNAGYVGAQGLIFTGDIDRMERKVQGPDVLTVITLADGQKALREVHVEKSYKKGTQVKTVVADLFDRMKNEAAVIAGGLTHIRNRVVNGGLSLSGVVEDVMQEVLNSAQEDAEFSIQDREAQVLTPGVTSDDDAVVLSPDTGLIGSPVLKEPGKSGTGNAFEGLELKALLIPSIKPGRRLRVQSKTINGTYKAIKVTYDGDTHGNAWFVNIQAKAV